MKVAVCTVAYNEGEYIRQHIEMWRPYVDKHLVLVSTHPWRGEPVSFDPTVSIATETGADIISRYWETEQDQRNWGIAYLFEYDYIIITDPDEFFTKEDIRKIIDSLESGAQCYVAARVTTYWKTPDYVFSPPDKHRPLIALNPKLVRIYGNTRSPGNSFDLSPAANSEVIDVAIHHMSWVHSDAKAKEKITSYSHSDAIPKGWYENVWLGWKPGDTTIIRPYGKEGSTGIYQPAPNEIRRLIA